MRSPTVDSKEKGCRIVSVSLPLLQNLLTLGTTSDDHPYGWRCIEGLPVGADLVDAWVDAHNVSQVHMIFEHESWEPNGPHDDTPELRVVFRQEPHP